MKLLVLAFSIVIFNIPFGYWRANAKRFTLSWILAIHIPVPVIVAERLISGIGFAWTSYPVIAIAFFTGHYLGSKLYFFMKNKKHFQVTSCFIMDCYRNCFSG